MFGYARDNDLFQKYGISSYSSMTFMNIYDISKKDEPLLLKNYTFEGSYFSARMIDDDVHLVLRNHPIYRDVFPTPLIIEGSMDSIRSVPVDRISYFPISYRNPELVVVHSFSLDDLGSLNSEAVTVDYANSIYMSNNNLYIVSDQYISEYELGQDVLKELAHPLLSRTELGLIGKIKQTDNDVLSQQEKESKIMGVYYAFLETLDYEAQEKFQDDIESETKKRVDAIDYFEYSVIHRLEIDGAKVSFKATGKVPGRIVNQFSLDEFDNNLRIATTISPRWSQFDDSRRTSTNSLWVLNNDLAVVGEMSDLAEDERIYSTRFVGDRLYMVTFRQVDPFFVIDLSNPQDPKVLGELKIPGFSKYLHPYDANHIIGIGQEATDTGRTTGLKISLFDVTDVSNPIEVAKYVTEERYVSSTALYEHKAFLFSKEKNLLVIPAFNHNYQENGEVYNGAFVFNISTEAIELRGLVDHSKGSAVSYGAKVQRSLYIDNLLYTLSPGLLRINALSDLHGVKDVDLEKTNSKIPVY